jgi:hypothetical protein
VGKKRNRRVGEAHCWAKHRGIVAKCRIYLTAILPQGWVWPNNRVDAASF